MAIFSAMKNKSANHGAHNETVCQYLDGAKDKHDWVVTTAFYSALHYARHAIFPYQMEVLPKKFQVFNTFDLYYAHIKMVTPNLNKHEAMKRLVRAQIPNYKVDKSSIGDRYDHLVAMSQNARYEDYDLDALYSKSAKENLTEIKIACLTARPLT